MLPKASLKATKTERLNSLASTRLSLGFLNFVSSAKSVEHRLGLDTVSTFSHFLFQNLFFSILHHHVLVKQKQKQKKRVFMSFSSGFRSNRDCFQAT